MTSSTPVVTRRRTGVVRSAPVGQRQRTATALSLMAPFFVLFAGATLAPIGYAVYLSLFAQQSSGLGFGEVQTIFVGLANYVTVLSDRIYLSSYAHIAGFALIAVPVILVSSAVLALMLDSAYAKAKRVFQLGVFIPHLVPGVIAGIVWLFLYTPGVSPIINFLGDHGLTVDLLGQQFALPAIANIALWQGLGYNTVVYFASLQAIPRELTEAATIDGAGEWRIGVSIKLPLIRAALGITAIFSVIGALQLFAEPLVLSGGGSAAFTANWTPSLYAYTEAFSKDNIGVATAAALVLALVAGGLSFVVTKLTKPWSS